MVAGQQQGDRGALGSGVEHLFAGAAEGDGLVLGEDEAVALFRGQEAFGAGLVHEDVDEADAVVEVDHQAQRLAMAASAGELVAGEREEAAVGGEDQKLVGGLGRDQEGELVALLELQLRGVLDPALGGADPAAVGENDGDRLAHDHGLERGFGVDLGGGGEDRAALADGGGGADDGEGVLQDVHWAGGSFGYFPSYALGYMYAAQFKHTMLKDLPNYDELLEKGDISPITNWLTEHIHQYGKMKKPLEILNDVTGEGLNVDYLIQYLEMKYGEIYHV